MVTYIICLIKCISFFNKMEDIRILISYGEHWEWNIYKDGYLEMVFMRRNLTYEALLMMVHEIVYADLNNCVYELSFSLNINGQIARFKIKNDRDVHCVLREGDGIP